MSTITVQVRHSGTKYNVDVDLNEPGATFKMQLYSITGVPPDRQKILVKGGQLKDDTDMNSLGLKPNQSLMMLGSAEELPQAPAVKHQFVEDMDDSQLARNKAYPSGLQNAGNTCYLNSTLQALRTIPELSESLKKYRNNSFAGMDLTSGLRDLYNTMSMTADPFLPMAFLNALRTSFPQFAERGDHGEFKQQDAEEAWSQILTQLKDNLKDENGKSIVEDYMGGQFEVTMKCDETEEEPKITHEAFNKLSCHISIETNFVRDGLMKGLEEKIEKNNETLGRNAEYTLTKKIERLPKYLTVQYVRFFWRRDTGKKSKILRKVAFPFNYDATELCTDELRQRLIPAREKYRELEKEQEELRRAAKKTKVQDNDEELFRKVSKEGKINESFREEMQKALEETMDQDLKTDPSCNGTGLYELAAIVTHQGPNADAGHYQCFTRNDNEPGKWWRFNDHKVSIVDETRIEQLAGGGESDSALILLYRAQSI